MRSIRKLAHVKLAKKALGFGATGWAFKFGAMSGYPPPTRIYSGQYTQRLEAKYGYQTIGDDVQSLIESQSVNSSRVKSGSGVVIEMKNWHNQKTSEALKLALEVRSGDLGKAGPGARAKADAKSHFKAKGSGSSVIPGANGFVPQNVYCQYHKSNPPLSCKSSIKVSDSLFQGDPPPEDGQFDMSQYKGGPNPFMDKFDYDDPNNTRENVGCSSQKRMNHAYDRHAKKCFGMQENLNKQNLEKFERKIRDLIESPETEKINGSYRYETPAYFYKEKDGNLVTIVNATDNSLITIVNATKSQLDSIRDDNNFGLDTRQSMQLRLRGPKNQN